MKHLNRHIVVAFALMLALQSCVYKRLYNDAYKYEQAGLLQLAIEGYDASLLRRSDFSDARIALHRTAARYAQELEQKIDYSYTNLNYDDIVINYLKLKEVEKVLSKYQLPLPSNGRTQQQYEDAKTHFVSEHYSEAVKCMESNSFTLALAHISQIKKVAPNYKNIAEMERISICEPLYITATEQMSIKQYRKAYNTLSTIIAEGGNYKDCKALQEECLEKGILIIAFTPMQLSNYSYQSFANLIMNNTKLAIQNANHRFTKMVDINYTENVVKEQKLAMANGIEINGHIIPIRAHLACKIPLLTYQQSAVKKTKRKGYIKEVKKDKSVVYHKVYYYECTQSATAQATFYFELRSTESALTLLSGSYAPTTSDNIKYIECSGQNLNNLRSGYWENSGKFDPTKDYVNDDILSIYNMSKLTSARRTLKTATTLHSALCDNIVQQLSRALLNFNPEQ